MVGIHCIFDIINIKNIVILEPFNILQIMDKIVLMNNFNVVERAFHYFKPIGFTAVYILAESHLSVHTFPEKGLCCIDVFCCSIGFSEEKIYNFILSVFDKSDIKKTILIR